MPYVEKNLTDEVFGDVIVADEPKPETKRSDMVASVQHLHGGPVALSDPGNQDSVRSRSCRTQGPSRRICRVESASGSTLAKYFLPRPRESICDQSRRSVNAQVETL